jgi:hypothetical protein
MDTQGGPLFRGQTTRADIRADVERCLELGAVAGLAAGQMEVERAGVVMCFVLVFCVY